jgi:hypothetical protein
VEMPTPRELRDDRIVGRLVTRSLACSRIRRRLPQSSGRGDRSRTGVCRDLATHQAANDFCHVHRAGGVIGVHLVAAQLETVRARSPADKLDRTALRGSCLDIWSHASCMRFHQRGSFSGPLVTRGSAITVALLAFVFSHGCVNELYRHALQTLARHGDLLVNRVRGPGWSLLKLGGS